MPSKTNNLHNSKITEIKNHFQNFGWECRREVKVIRPKEKIIDNEVGKIDVCCKKDNILRCFGVENGNQFQAVKNARDLEQIKKEGIRKGLSVKTCQLGSKENFKKVCK